MEKPSFQQALLDLRKCYAKALPERKAQLQEIWDLLGKTQDVVHLETLSRLVHNFSGSGVMYGFDALSVQAKQVESLIMQLNDQCMKNEGKYIDLDALSQLNIAFNLLWHELNQATQLAHE